MVNLSYSQATQDLIDRMCRNVERKDFRLQKKKAEECILRTYDLFNLPRPKQLVWCVDIFNQKFAGSAWSAGSAAAWSARSAGSAAAWSARSAGSAAAWSARSARSARSAWSAGSAAAWSAWSARSAGSAAARSAALDYDFDWYVFEFEYCKNPDKDLLPNDNDQKYLDYCELLMRAKEYGLGYRVEWDGVLYLVPTPLVLIDGNNRFHSIDRPAVRWKKGKEFYYLSGVNFDKKLWKKVTGGKITAKEILGLENMEQRMAALKVFGAEKLLAELNAQKVSEANVLKSHYELYRLDAVFSQSAYYLKYSCPSTGRVYVSGIDPEIGKKEDALDAISWKFGIESKEYLSIKAEA